MAGLPSFGTVNVGALSNAIAVAIQQASVSRPSSSQSFSTSVNVTANNGATRQQATTGTEGPFWHQTQSSADGSSTDEHERGSG